MKSSLQRKCSVGQGILDLLFPPKCIGCGELLEPFDPSGEVFCPPCRMAWEMGRFQLPRPSEIPLCSELHVVGPVSLTRYVSGRTNGVPERFIYHLKHVDDRRAFAYAAAALAPLLMKELQERDIPRESVLLTYPPRRPAAVRKDGFDQAKRLTRALSKRMGCPAERLLLRTGEGTREQKKLDAAARAKNAAKAYEVHPRMTEKVKGSVVILVDDLLTTGATLGRCARLILEAGASCVILATVGRAEERRAECQE